MDILDKYPIISDQVSKQELQLIVGYLKTVLAASIKGDVVEFGCYEGTTSLFLQRVLIGSDKQLHVYDSFEGLPEKSDADESPLGTQYKVGELVATKSQFIKRFRRARVKLPIIHKAWFKDLGPGDLPERICLAYLDGDFYESIKTSLVLIWPKLSPGALVLVDDYQHEALPGTRKAVDEWLGTHPASLRIQASLAIIKPRT